MLVEATISTSYGMSDFKKLQHHFIVARDLRTITINDFSSTLDQLIDVRKMLHGLTAKLSQSKESSPKRPVPSL